MLQDPLGIYAQARQRHEELHRRARNEALVATIKPAPGWRTASARALRRLADRVDGLGGASAPASPGILRGS